MKILSFTHVFVELFLPEGIGRQYVVYKIVHGKITGEHYKLSNFSSTITNEYQIFQGDETRKEKE